MAAVNNAAPILRRTAWSTSAPFRLYQRRWAQVHDVRFLATHQTADKVLDKYREKLEKKAREEGKGSVDELKQSYKEKIDALKEKAEVPGANAPLHAQQPPAPSQTASSVPYQAPPPPEPQTEAPAQSCRVSALPDREVEAIWRLRHVHDPQSLCATMHAETFRRIAATARKHPQFILPLPRKDQGARDPLPAVDLPLRDDGNRSVHTSRRVQAAWRVRAAAHHRDTSHRSCRQQRARLDGGSRVRGPWYQRGRGQVVVDVPAEVLRLRSPLRDGPAEQGEETEAHGAVQ
ncbi:hypothetical protein EPUL_006302, partial [Erysiphe pulchra]